MNSEQIRSILNSVMRKKFPEIEVEIYTSVEPDSEYHPFNMEKLIFNIFFHLPWYEHDKYAVDGIDKQKWDNIRALLKDLIKMLGISHRVKFYFSRQED